MLLPSILLVSNGVLRPALSSLLKMGDGCVSVHAIQVPAGPNEPGVQRPIDKEWLSDPRASTRADVSRLCDDSPISDRRLARRQKS